MSKNTVRACLLSAALAAPSLAGADQISLTSFDGTVSVTADFAGFQGENYILIYNGYEMVVPARNMSCEGEDCLQFTTISNVELAQNGG